MNCGNCGAYVSEGSRFCVSCGKKTESSAPPSGQNINYTGHIVETERDILAVFCYMGIFLIIPYIIRPGSQFIRYHANQGLMLLLLAIACAVVSVVPILGWIAAAVAGIFTFICWIIGIVNVLKGRMRPLPIIGKYTVL